jgi:hypothetical protein
MMTPRQESAWRGLLEVSALLPAHTWCVVGGQMVFLYCLERGVSPGRPTDDGDVVLDVRARPNILHEFTSALLTVGFSSAGVSPEGHQHRWVKDEAKIDVLVPRGLGERALARKGATGGTTLGAPGAQQAIDRSQPVLAEVAGLQGEVWRPSMLGALVMKAAAYTTPEPNHDRHLTDFATLASMLTRTDHIDEGLTRSDRKYLSLAVAALDEKRPLWVMIEGAERGIDVVRRVTSQQLEHGRVIAVEHQSPQAPIEPEHGPGLELRPKSVSKPGPTLPGSFGGSKGGPAARLDGTGHRRGRAEPSGVGFGAWNCWLGG